jgi:hypothetical protein
MSAFECLSIELIDEILQHLAAKDLAAVRLVSRTLNHKGHRICCSALFGAIVTDFSKESLHELHRFSTHPQLPHFVHTLRVRSFVQPPSNPEHLPWLGAGFHWTRDDNGCLKMSNEGIKLSQEILHRLVNCTKIRVDAGYEKWSSVPEFRASEFTESDCFFILFTIFTLEERKIDLFHYPLPYGPSVTHWAELDFIAAPVRLRRIPYSTLQSRGSDDFRTKVSDLSVQMVGDPGDQETFVMEFLKSVTNLRSVSLGFSLGSDVIDVLVANHRCRNLQHLLLSNPIFSGTTWRKLLEDCGATLLSLELRDARFIVPDSWLPLLPQLPARLPRLQSFAVYDLYDCEPSPYPNGTTGDIKWRILFQGLYVQPTCDAFVPAVEEMGFALNLGWRCRTNVVLGVAYEGKDMSKALDIIVNAVVPFPPM